VNARRAIDQAITEAAPARPGTGRMLRRQCACGAESWAGGPSAQQIIAEFEAAHSRPGCQVSMPRGSR
jgi:hypothetical protein